MEHSCAETSKSDLGKATRIRSSAQTSDRLQGSSSPKSPQFTYRQIRSILHFLHYFQKYLVADRAQLKKIKEQNHSEFASLAKYITGIRLQVLKNSVQEDKRYRHIVKNNIFITLKTLGQIAANR